MEDYYLRCDDVLKVRVARVAHAGLKKKKSCTDNDSPIYYKHSHQRNRAFSAARWCWWVDAVDFFPAALRNKQSSIVERGASLQPLLALTGNSPRASLLV